MFKNVIVRTPGKSLTEGITSSPGLGKPDYALALRQHAAYIAALQSCGVEAMVLPADEAFPDSCFVEDVAVVSEKCAILTNPGADSRKGEVANIVSAIERFYTKEHVHAITEPGTLEGGDVMRVDDCFYVGRSLRTNAEGIAQFAAFLQPYGYTVVEVPLTEFLHLKTGVNYLSDNRMLVSGEFITKPEFARYEKTVIPEDEGYAANSLWVNGKVLVPADFPKTEACIREMGYTVLVVDTSEFRKLDGGLSCLSLRF